MTTNLRANSDLPSSRAAAELLAALRDDPPLVQCITNQVVTGFTANVLLAAGASAAMVDLVGEAGPFAQVASGLLINLGTPHQHQREAGLEAAKAAQAAGTPWVLDPVAIGSLGVRTEYEHAIVKYRPTAIRGNASEIRALARHSEGGRGVDATDSADSALEAAAELAREFGSVVAISGPTDIITDGSRSIRIDNGHRLLTQVTGGGCALGALMAAYLGVARTRDIDPMTAVAACAINYEIAAEQAAEVADGPGSFAVALLDALASLQPDQIAGAARVGEDD